MATNSTMRICVTSIAPHAEDDAVDDYRDDAYENMGTLRRVREGVLKLSANPAGGTMGSKIELMCLKAKILRWVRVENQIRDNSRALQEPSAAVVRS